MLFSLCNRSSWVSLAVASTAALATVLTLLPPVEAQAQSVVVPYNLTATEGDNAATFVGAYTFQQLISSSLLSSIPGGASITGFAFRFDDSQAAINSAITFANFDVRLGGSAVSALAVGQSFAANEASGTVLARSGALTFAANAFPSGGSPNAFGPIVTFSTPYTYQGGNLLFTMSYSGLNTSFKTDIDDSSAGNDYMQRQGYNAATSNVRYDSVSLIPQFQFSAGGAAATPEPGSIVLLALSGLPLVGVIARRRKSA